MACSMSWNSPTRNSWSEIWKTGWSASQAERGRGDRRGLRIEPESLHALAGLQQGRAFGESLRAPLGHQILVRLLEHRRVLDRFPPRLENVAREPAGIAIAAASRVHERRCGRVTGPQDDDRARHQLRPTHANHLAIPVELRRLVAGHARVAGLPGRAVLGRARLRAPAVTPHERVTRRRVGTRHGELVVEMVGVGPAEVPRRLTEDRRRDRRRCGRPRAGWPGTPGRG